MSNTNLAQPEAQIKAYEMLIGGKWCSASSGQVLESENPATEEVIATIPDATDADIDAAVEAARVGFAEWSGFGWKKRAKILRELAARMDEQTDQFVSLDVLDSGKPIKGMHGDAQKAPQEFLYFAGLASQLKGVTFETPDNSMCFTLREPYGIVGRIIPFNHPYRFCAKIAVALAAGNVVILKPSEYTSLSALEFAKLSLDLFPDGVVNVVTGRGPITGAAIARHPKIPRVAFTGGVVAGKAVLREGAEHMKHVTLELGGKNPMIVFPDADVTTAATGCIRGMNLARSMGQSCQSNSRVFVHAKIHDEFVASLVSQVQDLKVGDPKDERVDMGALAYAGHYHRVMALIESGKAEGASLLTGGKRPAHLDKGYFVEPTVFADVQDGMRIANEEIFGPVISVFKWQDWDDMIQRANDIRFGLTANIWTNDISLANRTARAVQAGFVWINGQGGRVTGSPFGGYKESGLGKEGDLSDLLSYTREKCIQTSL